MYQKLEPRELRGLRLTSRKDAIRRINKLHYQVRSESDDDVWYDIKRKYGSNLGGRQDAHWRCTCKDFQFRHISPCKHGWIVIFSKKLREKIVPQNHRTIHTELSSDIVLCLKCKTDKTRKDGKRYNKGKKPSQKYLCLTCNYRFTVNIGFEN